MFKVDATIEFSTSAETRAVASYRVTFAGQVLDLPLNTVQTSFDVDVPGTFTATVVALDAAGVPVGSVVTSDPITLDPGPTVS